MKFVFYVFGAAFLLLTGGSPVWAEPVTLEQAFVQAYANNPSLEAARAKLRATDEQVSQALEPLAAQHRRHGQSRQDLSIYSRTATIRQPQILPTRRAVMACK